MIPTILFALIVSILIGLLFARCAGQQFRGGVDPWGRELGAVLSYEAIIVWPLAMYFHLVFPDWCWLYLVDPHRLPSGVTLLVLVGYVATLMGGYLAGWALLRARKERQLLGTIAGVAFALLVFVLLTRHRLLHEGTYAEYHAGQARTFAASKLGWALAVTALGGTVSSVMVGFSLWEHGKRFRG